MAASPAELESRVRVLETRSNRQDEDFTALMDTVVETRQAVATLSRKVDGLSGKVDSLQRGMNAIVAHLGLTVEPEATDD